MKFFSVRKNFAGIPDIFQEILTQSAENFTKKLRVYLMRTDSKKAKTANDEIFSNSVIEAFDPDYLGSYRKEQRCKNISEFAFCRLICCAVKNETEDVVPSFGALDAETEASRNFGGCKMK